MTSTIRIDSTAALEAAYHGLIPISAHMGLSVTSWSGGTLMLRAPLANNINHQQSAFGGSLFSIAALAGWGLLQLKLNSVNIDANTVIADGDVSYRRPVFDDFECICTLPESYAAFEDTLKEKGKSALILAPEIMVNGEVAMTFSGRYVVTVKA